MIRFFRKMSRLGWLVFLVMSVTNPLIYLAVASILLGLVSMYATVQGGKNQAKIAQANAARQRQQALREQEAAERRAEIAKIQRDRERRSARVAYAASGVDIGEGSPLIIEAEDDYRSEVNQQTIIATGYDIAGQTRSAAAIEVARGNAARSQAYGSAAGQGASLLGNAYTAFKD
jgi:hypothetical protein